MDRRLPIQNGLKYLDDDEMYELMEHIHPHQQGNAITYDDVKETLNEVQEELFGRLNDQDIIRRNQVAGRLNGLLGSIFGPGGRQISRDGFAHWIRQQKIPSLRHARERENAHRYFETRHKWRKVRAYCTVHGPEIVFIGLVIAMQAAFATWQAVKFDKNSYEAAFGPGLIVAKACSGALYPTFFLLLLSTSRYLSTMLRRSYFLSRFLSLDHSKAFHIYISCVALLLSTIHSAAHLSGTFSHGSRLDADTAVFEVVSREKLGQHYYIDYIRSVPGYTGIAALSLFFIMAVLATPRVRRWNYDLFQLSHTLMYPLLALMFAHGSRALLQAPLFGYFVAVPALLVVLERLSRVISGFYKIKATLTILDEDTVQITALVPKYRLWDYTAGQYIFLQVPEISFFQWHPFTISYCRGKQLTLHIKTNGDWTSKLRNLPQDIAVGINGPFGAPAQRFYSYQRTIIVGAGIGVTPFSAILADLQDKNDLETSRTHTQQSADESHPATSPRTNDIPNGEVEKPLAVEKKHRKTELHWIVRSGKSLMWLNDLLNRVSESQQRHCMDKHHTDLEIDINTYITANHGHIATHVFSWILEMGRTQQNPYSPLTGLINPTNFGRPNFDHILDEHYNDTRAQLSHEIRASQADYHHKVGVFCCGAAAVGEILADKCAELSIRGQKDGSKIEYHFIKEVFG